MKIQALGPLRLVDGRGTSVQPPARLATLVAALVACFDEALPAESLAEAIWPQRPPRDGLATVRRHVARARSDLGLPIIGEAGGYRLVVAREEIDTVSLLDVARAATHSPGRLDAAVARTVLDGWRSSPFPELADWHRGTVAAARLEAARLDLTTLLAEHQLVGGAPPPSWLIPLLQTSLREHPYHEDLWAHLMTALYRAGRGADALAAFAEARRSLADDLGIEPGPALVALEAAVLTHRLDAAPTDLRPIAGLRPLVGRDEELAAVVAAWRAVTTDAASGKAPPRLVIVNGEAGAGKSRLLDAAANRCAERIGGLGRRRLRPAGPLRGRAEPRPTLRSLRAVAR